MIEVLRILFLIVFFLADVIIYLLIWNILTEKGQNLLGFRTHVNNLLDFYSLANKTIDAREKSYYRILIRSYLIILLLLIGLILTYFI